LRCSFCGYEFDEMESARSCEGCPIFSSCRLVKCPRCGFETPVEPGLVKTLRKWRRKKIET
jgi:hypothetical protein